MSSVAIINSYTIETTFAQTISDANTFDVTINNQKYPLKYNTTGGEVTNISADPAQSTFLINIASSEDGTLTIELPRNVIDSKAQGNTDEDYAVFIDDQPKAFEEITNNNEVRTLQIGFDKGAEKIEIAGTQITAKGATGTALLKEVMLQALQLLKEVMLQALQLLKEVMLQALEHQLITHLM